MQSAVSKAEAGPTLRTGDTGSRLGMALLVYMIGVTLIVTLVPFHFAWPQAWRISVGDDPYDFVLNALLFVPLGFLYRMVTPRGWGAMLLVVVNAALISVAIEAMQIFDATREATALDVIAATLGALAGVLAFDRIARSARASGRVIGWLGLEIPLMGLVYLLVPLLWVNTLAARGEPVPTAATLLIGVFGAVLLGGLQRQYFGPARQAEPQRTALFAALWFLAGALAMLPWRLYELAGGAIVVALLCWWLGRRPLPEGSNRRFEGRLLRTAAPVYGAYLATLIAAPLLEGIGPAHGHFGFTGISPSRVEIAQLLELCAAFTLVGYMVTENRGREVMRYRDALPRLIAWAVGLALAAEAARGFGVHGASLARGLLVIAACCYGGWLYYLQRAHVIRLVSRNTREG